MRKSGESSIFSIGFRLDESRLDDPSKYQSIVDAEWNIIYAKLQACVDSGAKIVLSRLAIGDLATQYFAVRDVFCAGRVPKEDLDRVAKAVGAQVQTTVTSMDPKALGQCKKSSNPPTLSLLHLLLGSRSGKSAERDTIFSPAVLWGKRPPSSSKAARSSS